PCRARRAGRSSCPRARMPCCYLAIAPTRLPEPLRRDRRFEIAARSGGPFARRRGGPERHRGSGSFCYTQPPNDLGAIAYNNPGVATAAPPERSEGMTDKKEPWGKNVLVEFEDGIAWVTLNRPEKRNAMS